MRGLNEVFMGGLGSYATMLMAVSFFQNHPLIQMKMIDPEENLGVMFMEFLELYGRNFNYDQVGITLASQGCYYDKKVMDRFNAQKPFLLSLMDPQDDTNDVGKNTYNLPSVRSSMSHAFNLLASMISRYTDSRNRHKISQYSLLSLIVTVDDDTVSFRKRVVDIVRNNFSIDIDNNDIDSHLYQKLCSVYSALVRGGPVTPVAAKSSGKSVQGKAVADMNKTSNGESNDSCNDIGKDAIQDTSKGTSVDSKSLESKKSGKGKAKKKNKKKKLKMIQKITE
jgi:DNA polymerase sigma